MTKLRRPVLWVADQKGFELYPADPACASCPAPCHALAAPPSGAHTGEVALSSNLLNRLAFCLFGLPLLLLGSLVWAAQSFADQAQLPAMLLVGMTVAFVFASRVARKTLPEVDLALKATGVEPIIHAPESVWSSWAGVVPKHNKPWLNQTMAKPSTKGAPHG